MTLEGKTVLVTGATGFLGGALARRLAQDGAKVRAVVRNPDRARYIQDQPNIELIDGDITDAAKMREVTKGCEYVFHSAAALGGSLKSQRKVNVEGTRNVITAAEADVKRFIHISTISVYGYKNTADVTEETPPSPGYEGYGVSKWEAEQVVHEIGSVRNLEYVIIRPGMIYGPRSGMWTGQMFKLARRRPTIFIGSGSGSSYPIHVDDVVDLTVLAATHPAAANETFNCTPDPSPTWRAFLGAYSHLSGHGRWFSIPPFLLRPIAWLLSKIMPLDSRLRDLPDLLPFSQRYISYKMNKAQSLLGWQPRISLSEGIIGCETWLREKDLLK